MITLTIIGLVYLASFILVYGLSFAYWQGHYQKSAKKYYWEDMRSSLKFAVFGPFILLFFLLEHKEFDNFKHGFKLW